MDEHEVCGVGGPLHDHPDEFDPRDVEPDSEAIDHRRRVIRRMEQIVRERNERATDMLTSIMGYRE